MLSEGDVQRHSKIDGCGLVISGRAISPGKAKGEVLKLDGAFSFLGGVDAVTGDLKTEREGNIAGKIFVFPKGKGSTVGSFVMYDLAVHGKAPAAVINNTAETIVTTGAVISSIPMVDKIDTDIFRNGDMVSVDGTAGTVDIEGVKMIKVVSSAICVNDKILLLKRPDTARSFPGTWSLVAGKVEEGETVEEAAAREIAEETKIHVGHPVSQAPAVYVREGNILWEVYPFMYRLDSADPVLNRENVGFMWVDLEELKTMPSAVPLTYEVVFLMSKMKM